MAPTQDNLIREVVPNGGVVVGDDGSRHASLAVRYAVEEAARRGTTLHVVRAWTIMSSVHPAGVPLGITPSVLEMEESTLAAEQERVARIVGDTVATVQVHTAYGPSAQALIKASETAEVLVVGSRGRGGFKTLVLGSVADQVIRHAQCPVIVVRNWGNLDKAIEETQPAQA
ncbi:universal stress protein [Nocardioides sp. AE5]|uniref:universal stress protein n=1 Tax=Nocardioides sp. AE5 TaxID=2962573 RepID=UPI0028820D1A|nr:universal stress protein [Nocardioides sp. AE5]MDT0201055.1 universal stress protein [Nocardioides sp. AE5]